MHSAPPSVSADLPRWTRRLTSPLVRLASPPVRIDSRVAAGVTLVLHHSDGSRVSLWLSPSEDASEAFFRGRHTALRYLGEAPLGAIFGHWVRALCQGILRAERHGGWRAFLAAAQRTPAAPMSGGGHSGQRVTSGDALLLRITTRCQGSCAFCNARGVLEDLVEDPAHIQRALAQAALHGAPSVSFTGGEPTLRTDLPALVASARAAGISRVDLQTNGIRLARPGVVEELLDAGITSIFLSLHSASASVHDAVLGVPEAHSAALCGARRCLDAGIDVCVNHVITRQNLQGLEPFVRLLAARLGRVALRLSFVSPQGGGAEHPELMPRLTEAAAEMALAIRLGQEHGLDVRIPGLCGIPPCLLPEHVSLFDELRDTGPPPRLVTRRQVRACEGCQWKHRCTGFWRSYFLIHGEHELKSICHTSSTRLP